jgi:hypothetical protein
MNKIRLKILENTHSHTHMRRLIICYYEIRLKNQHIHGKKQLFRKLIRVISDKTVSKFVL